jgi:hypothetical protein
VDSKVNEFERDCWTLKKIYCFLLMARRVS